MATPARDEMHDVEDAALLALLKRLDEDGYDFVPPTPPTHARVLKRPPPTGADVRDILGWSRRFTEAQAPSWLVELLHRAGMLEACGEVLKSKVRAARLQGRLLLHSAFPTQDRDAVFLGPDSYRFAAFLRREIEPDETGLVVDLGGGCGAGALTVATAAPKAEIVLSDINPLALRLARVAARHAGVRLHTRQAHGFPDVAAAPRLVVANPPYVADVGQTYQDGGGMHGGEVALAWAQAALDRLAPGGRMLLYTGAAVVTGGRDELREALTNLAATSNVAIDYREVDPDVFGEELDRPAYADVERIAAVTCVLAKPPT